MKKIKKAKKQSYLLLELLLAFFLLTLFLAPMLSSPFAYVRKQKEEITFLYFSLEEEKLLSQIEEKLRSGQIPWETLLSSEEAPVLLETKTLKIPGDDRIYEAKLFLAKGTFKTQEGVCFGTVKAAIKIFQKAQKKPKKKPAFLTLFVLKKYEGAPHAAS